MAASVYPNIRLDTALTGALPTSTWAIAYQSRRDINYALSSSERGLDGDLMVHRIVDGSGNVMQYIDRDYQFSLTRAEYESLMALVGKVCYFMPHIRDESAPLSYRTTVLVKQSGDERPWDPMMEYFSARLYLEAAENGTVDS